MGQSVSRMRYAGKRKKTRREIFLDEMELVGAMEGACEGHRAVLPVAGRGRSRIRSKRCCGCT